ncbi:cyanophycinase [Chitinimonas sp. PSY-7]|uniref:cyanophycinase n=1 Tax=Chitinimonas sp. PSY-7 TaxID=3459088 RepID=UPI00403FD2E4
MASIQRWLATPIVLVPTLLTPTMAQHAEGSLVMIGGALRYDNTEIWQRVVNLAGGHGAKIAVFGTASDNPTRTANSAISALNKAGADAFFVPIGLRQMDVDYKAEVHNPRLVKQIMEAKGVYFTGGDQLRIVQALYNDKGLNTPVLDAIWSVYRKGGVIAGTSAGAAIMSTSMFGDPKDPLTMLKNGMYEGKETARGLGFIGPDIFVDQHLLIRGRFARMFQIMHMWGYQQGIGIDENTAVVVHGKEAEVIGYRGALVVDLSESSSDNKLPAFNIRNVKLSYLDHGDRYNFGSKALTPSAAKINEPKIDPNDAHYKPYHKIPNFAPNILGNSTVVDVMSNLIDSVQQETIGLAFGDPQGEKPELGFEFRFRKGRDSMGWYAGSAAGEDYTVANIYVDVTPVRLNHPLYRPYQP